MRRFVSRTTFALLALILTASLVSLLDARFDLGMEEKPYLLAQPNLTSPRTTLQTLMANGEVAQQQILTIGVPWSQTPSMQRMMDTMNVEDLPLASRDLKAALAASQLWDVLKHIELPPWSDVPDLDAVRRDQITQWQVPDTAIVIERVSSGPRSRQFLFSPQTVMLADALHDTLGNERYGNAAVETVYTKWRFLPGPMIPHRLIDALPAPLRASVFGQAVWQWIGLAVLLFVTIAASLHIIFWGVRHDADAAGRFRRFGQPLAALAVTGLCFMTLALAQYALKVWGAPLEAILFLMPLAAIGGFGWFAITAMLLAGDTIIAAYAMQETSLDAQLVRVISTLSGIAIGIVTVFVAADFIGVPIGPLLAGIGIGGLAVALAVRPTLENVIGGLTLFADRTARVGEFCRIGTETGTIEEIGLRTTKIRRLDDTVVTIPNAELAQTRIQNLSRRRRFPFETTVSLPIGTTDAQVRRITGDIQTVLQAHQSVLADSVRVRLTNFGEKTMTLELRAHVDVTRNSAFLAVQEELQLQILDIVRRSTEATP